MDWAPLLGAFAIAAFGAYLRMAGGFGFSLFVFPLLAAQYDALTAVSVTVCVELLLGIYLVIRWPSGLKSIGTLFMAVLSLLGAGVFTSFIARSFDERITYFVGLGAAAAGALLLLVPSVRVSATFVSRTLAGFTSGVLGAACGISGPPVLLIVFGDRERPWRDIRARLYAYFAILYLGIFVLRADAIAARVTENSLAFATTLAGAIAGTALALAARPTFNTSQWSVVGGLAILTAVGISVALRVHLFAPI